MKRKQWDDEEGVSPVIAVILMVAITVVLAAVLYVWASSFLQQGENAPIVQMDCTEDSNGNYRCVVIKISENIALESFQYFLKDESGLTKQFGEIALQNMSGGVWHGVDVTWDDDGDADGNNDGFADRADGAGGAYSDPTQAETRINAVLAGSQSGVANQKSEGTISVQFNDNDRNGKFTAGDQIYILGNGVTHTATDDYKLEIKFDITDDTVGTFKLGS